MKAPDKIFIDEDLIAYHCLTDRHDGDIEYIRKDILLEWAREKEEMLGKMFDVVPSMVLGAKLVACKEFIDKIKEL